MREIDVRFVGKLVTSLFIEANYILPEDIRIALDEAYSLEDSDFSREIVSILRKNYEIAEEMQYPLCQDTGMAVVFCEIGQDVHFTGGSFPDAIQKGVGEAYRIGYLRKSVVAHPLERTNTGNNLPAIIYSEIVPGDGCRITVLPKGFGSENQSRIRMFTPSATKDDIIDFIVKEVSESGGKGCPPCILGVGIGGTFEYAALLSKKALCTRQEWSEDSVEYEIANEIKKRINARGIGPLGMGGKTACLDVRINTFPTHIAGLPVAYNYCCHSCRHSEGSL